MRALATLRSHAVTVLVTTGAVVAVVVATVIAAGSGPPSVAFREPGHWVYNRIERAAFHVDAGTRRVDARVDVPSSAGDPLMVLQGHREGYVVARDAVSPFARAALTVGAPAPAARDEVPVGVEVVGGPYLVYPQAGTIVRLGEPRTSVEVGGPVGAPVRGADGSVWVHRPDTGEVCALRGGAVTLDCSARTAPGAAGALTVVAGRPAWLDPAAGTLADLTHGSSTPIALGDTLATRPAVSRPARSWSARPRSRAACPSSCPTATRSCSPTWAAARPPSSTSARAAGPRPSPPGTRSPSSTRTAAGSGRSTPGAHRGAPPSSRPARPDRSPARTAACTSTTRRAPPPPWSRPTGRSPRCPPAACHGPRRPGGHGRPGRGRPRQFRPERSCAARRPGRRGPPGPDRRRGQAPGRRAHRVVARAGRRRRPLHRRAQHGRSPRPRPLRPRRCAARRGARCASRCRRPTRPAPARCRPS